MNSPDVLSEAQPRYSEHSVSSARKFFGFAISHAPAPLMHNLGTPSWTELSEQVTTYISYEAAQRGIYGNSGLLQNGIHDTQRILKRSLEQRSAEEALAFSSHPYTIEAIARIALRSDDQLHNLIGGLYHPVTHSQSGDFHPAAGIKPESAAGCPFAGHDGKLTIDPLFARFVPWSAALSIESLRFRGKLR